MGMREARRKLMRVDLCTRATIEIDDLQSNASRLEQDIGECLHSRVINLNLMRINVDVAVAGDSMRKHEGGVVICASFHPGRGESLLE